MDVVGLDVVLDIENHYRKLRPGLPDGTTKILEKMIAEGKLGVKSGAGFYNYKTDI
jgi:3-hydroxybutyryl-CoA dehydrogenase